MLIEKAWAKINGGYFKIRRVSQSFLGIHLTGVPAENIKHNVVKFFKNGCWNTHPELLEKCWERIQGAFERKYTLVADARESYELNDASSIQAERDY